MIDKNSKTNEDTMSEFGKTIKKIIEEVESKKMVPMQFVLEVLKDYGPYCYNCDADSDTYLDCSGEEPAIRCMWCKKAITIKNIAKRARALPGDYLERMIAIPAKRTMIEQIREDTWITDGYALAEIAGDIRLSYPDRGKFKQTDCISKILTPLSQDGYEEAEISKTLYRERFGYNFIAALKSKTHTAYINNDFVKHMEGIYKPLIRGPLEPVLIKAHGKLRGIVLPIRFKPIEEPGDDAQAEA